MKRLGALAASVVLIVAGGLAACRGDDDTAGGAGGARRGVTADPCPRAVDPAKGCVYLGVISDLTVGAAKDDAVYRVGYVGIRRYLRVVATAANTPGNTPIAVLVVGEKLLSAPAA